MLFCSSRAHFLDRLARMLNEDRPLTEKMSGTAEACERAFSSRATLRVKALIDAGAWTDAALELLAIELPEWKLRRLAYDDGEWYCAISRERELPEWLVDSIQTRDIDLAAAVLKSIVEALGFNNTGQPRELSVVTPSVAKIVICDNFG